MRFWTVAVCCGVFATAAAAQDPAQPPTPAGRREPKKPVFTPPSEEAPKPAPAPAVKKAEPQDAAATRPATYDAVDELFARFVKWPARQAREAAEAVSGLGAKVEDRLIGCLDHNDWRMQAAAAYALGQMGAKKAAPALIRAIREPSNRQSLNELMNALGKVDPERGPSEILPFLAHASPRVRDAALAALPPALDGRYLEDVLALAAAQRGPSRAVALELLGRIPGGQERDELFLALGDPETAPADAASKLLGARAGDDGLARLARTVKEGTMRSSAYAMLALVVAEDRRAKPFPVDDDALRLRGVKLLQSDDPFYRGAAAVFLANMSYRSDEKSLAEMADKFLVPILIDTAAGGVFFNDYAAIEDVAFRKLEKLTGRPFGRNGAKWKSWWARSGDGFVARRLLRSLSAEDAAKSVVEARRVDRDGRTRSAVLAGENVRADDVPDRALIFGAEEAAKISALFAERRFFAGAGDGPDAVEGGYVEVSVGFGSRRFERRRAGADAVELAPTADALFAVEDALVWQRFAPADAVARIRWIADRRAELAPLAADARADKLFDLALEGYTRFDRDGRAAAVRVAAAAPEARLKERAALLAAWLRAENSCNEQAATIIKLLANTASPEAREEVFAFHARAPGLRTDEALLSYLATRDFPAATAAFKAKNGFTRAVAARALARFGGEPDAAPMLLEGLRDPEPRVRDACVRSLAEMKDPRTLAMIDAVLAGADKSLRVRAIEALGAVGGDASTPRLVEIFDKGDVHERGAVLRALEKAGGASARNALAAVARECPDGVLASESVLALARIGGDDAAARVASLFKGAPSREVRLQCAAALQSMLGTRAAPYLLPSLADPDPTLRRMATIVLGRVGGRAALDPLLKLCEAPAGDAAAEDALRRLTFFASDKRTPRERMLESRAWADANGNKSRAEWFRMALVGARLDPAALEDRLLGGPLDAAGFALLVRAIKVGAGPLREAADAQLRAATKLDLPALAADADDAATAARMTAYENWADEHADDLRRRLPPDPFAFEAPPAEAAPAPPAAAPAAAPDSRAAAASRPDSAPVPAVPGSRQ